MINPEPIHILMRFSDKLGAIEDTVEAHSIMIKKHGAVWFGKMGKTLSRQNIERLNKQCEQGTPTHLYLVQKTANRYEIYRGVILAVRRETPIKDRKIIPPYYEKNRLSLYMNLWVKLSGLDRIELTSLSSLYIATSGFAAPETLRASMAAIFIIKERFTALQ